MLAGKNRPRRSMLTGTAAVLDHPRQIPGQQRQHFPSHFDCWCLGHCQLGHCVYSRPKYIREAIVSSLSILRISCSFTRYLYAVRIYKPASSTSPIAKHSVYGIHTTQQKPCRMLGAKGIPPAHRRVPGEIHNTVALVSSILILFTKSMGLPKANKDNRRTEGSLGLLCGSSRRNEHLLKLCRTQRNSPARAPRYAKSPNQLFAAIASPPFLKRVYPMFAAGDFLSSVALEGVCSYGDPVYYVRQRYSKSLSEASETVYT